MELFFAEHWEVVSGFIALLLTMIGFLIKSSLNNTDRKGDKMENRIIEVEKDMKEMKDNYIERFEEVMTKLNEFALTTKDSLHAISTKLDKQVTICKMVQESKEHSIK